MVNYVSDHVFCMYHVLQISGNAVWQSITCDLISKMVGYNILEFGILMKLVRFIKMCLN